MSCIKIKNFGPIKEGFKEILPDGTVNEWMDIKKVTMFIGNQGSGKSTVAKLISTFTWMEKALTRGDYDFEEFTLNNKFREHYCAYHRLDRYFFDINGSDIADIAYEGDAYEFGYKNGILTVHDRKNGHYPLPQVMYVPAERNFLVSITDSDTLRLAADSLGELYEEFNKAKNKIDGLKKLPINDASLEYDNFRDMLFVVGKINEKDYRVRLTEASSGFHSLVPLYLVSEFLAEFIFNETKRPSEIMTTSERERFRKKSKLILDDNNLSDEQKRILISELTKNFNKTAFINIVEEPEQNLFPTSQNEILYSLLEFNNRNSGNKLIMTTHSPYLINDLTLAIEANNLLQKIKDAGKEDSLNQMVYRIVRKDSIIRGNDVAIYEMDETSGTISLLGNYKGLPSDENKLNNELGLGNDQFVELLEIENKIKK